MQNVQICANLIQNVLGIPLTYQMDRVMCLIVAICPTVKNTLDFYQAKVNAITLLNKLVQNKNSNSIC